MISKVRVNNLNLNVYDAGQGRPILFVHGFPLDHTMWQTQLDKFAATHRVIAPDLRGFGQSEGTAGTVEMKDFANDLAALLEVLDVNEPVCYCGLSMGGYIGWQFWRLHAKWVSSLILCDTKAAADSPEAVEGRMKLANEVMEKGAQAVFDAMFPKLISERSRYKRPDVVEPLRNVIVNTDPESIGAALRGMAGRPDATSLLATINVPTLVICGKQDILTPPEEMQKVADGIKGAKFVEIPDAGHMSPMENSAAVNEAMEAFLEG